MATRVASLVAVMEATAIYYALIEYVDLYPWNDIREGSGQEKLDPAVLAVQGVLMAGTAVDARWARSASIAAYGGWLALQVGSWWVPYLLGASDPLQRRYDRYFSSTVKFLPRIRDRQWVPDAAHVVLQGLVATCVIMAVRRDSRATALLS